MTTPGDPGEGHQGQPPSGGNEPTPFDQAETRFAPIPPPDYPPPAYTPPPPAGGMPPSGYPPQGYPPPPAYPPPPSYQPPSGGYAQQPYQTGYPSPPYAGGYGPPQPRTNGMAIGSLVTSIVAFPLALFCAIFGVIAAIAGVALGIVALNQIKQSGEQGRGLAIAGIATGGVTLLLAVVLLFAIGLYAFNNS